MVAKVFIDGEAGTTGLQIRDRLAARDDIELLAIPQEGRKDLGVRAEYLNAADVAILCLPDDAARESVGLITSSTTRVIDASSAFRVAEGWTYGFAEMSTEQSAAIADAKRVTNPGCWPQGVIAGVRPLVEAGLLPADVGLSVNGISGYSGGGKAMIADYEVQGADASELQPYGLQFAHKHLPEMQAYCELTTRPLFVPAVGDYYKGMLTSVPLHMGLMAQGTSVANIHAVLTAHYGAMVDGFVSVAPLDDVNLSTALNPQALNGTNELHLHVFGSDSVGQAVIIAVYDNLGKGASGAAVQNLNLMIGADSKAGL